MSRFRDTDRIVYELRDAGDEIELRDSYISELEYELEVVKEERDTFMNKTEELELDVDALKRQLVEEPKSP